MTTPPTSDSLSAALRRLEEIVRHLEADDTDLDRALVLFEEGVPRLRSARDRPTEAEARAPEALEGAARPRPPPALAVVLVEEGVAGLRSARARLSDAEARVQKVLEDAAGQLTVTDLDE